MIYRRYASLFFIVGMKDNMVRVGHPTVSYLRPAPYTNPLQPKPYEATNEHCAPTNPCNQPTATTEPLRTNERTNKRTIPNGKTYSRRALPARLARASHAPHI